MNYFQKTNVNIVGNTLLRTPQLEAYLKIEGYFNSNPTGEALVVLPTGTGKSGLISIAPYGVSKGRVLVVTPNLITKDSIRKTQEVLEDNFWVNFNIIFDPNDLPIINTYDSDISQEHLESSHFVITNIQQTKNLMNRVQSDFFDMVIIDESHHSVAESWRVLLDYFNNVKVLHVTGTPYRGDNQRLPGEQIHETKLSDVMRDKYVKWLRKETVDAHELYFTMPSDPQRKLTKDEVLAFKDREWIEKSVAMSPECSMDVINHSIEKYNELKKLSPDVPHKILAVGCSIAHAEDIKNWYQQQGLKTVIVHSYQEEKENQAALKRIELNDCQVVVSVNMLMEGYDHRYLSILSIFRPYRSINAFAQIVGRVLRVIPNNEIVDFHIDNNALVVYHKETGLDDMWNIFQDEVNRAQKQVSREYSISEEEYEARENTLAGISSSTPYVTDQSSYLSDLDFNELFERKKKEIEDSVNEDMKKIGQSGLSAIQLEVIEKALRDQKTKETNNSQIDPLMLDKRPAQARKTLRSILTKNIQDEVANLLSDLGIDESATDLSIKFARFSPIIKSAQTKNDATLVIYLNVKLRAKFGSVESRTNDVLLQSVNLIHTLIEETRRMIK